jgi:hypothetical protein
VTTELQKVTKSNDRINSIFKFNLLKENLKEKASLEEKLNIFKQCKFIINYYNILFFLKKILIQDFGNRSGSLEELLFIDYNYEKIKLIATEL